METRNYPLSRNNPLFCPFFGQNFHNQSEIVHFLKMSHLGEFIDASLGTANLSTHQRVSVEVPNAGVEAVETANKT